MTTPYPEHDKMSKVQPAAQVIGEFLEWLTGPRGIALTVYAKDAYLTADTETLLYEYFEIDRARIDAEKEQMLADIRADSDSAVEVLKSCRQCRMRGGHKMDCSETR